MTATRARGVATASLLMLLLNSGCGAVLPTGPPLPHAVQERSTEVTVQGGRLKLHLAASPMETPGSRPLVLYASGDGGWFGAAVGMFHTIAASGYPTVGISSKELLRLERQRFKPLGGTHVADAYRQIIDAARRSLGSPADAPVVLTGWSRGAALGAVASARIDASSHVVGLVAIGLAAEEHLDLDADNDDDVEAESPPPLMHPDVRGRSIALYPLLSELTMHRVRVVVLQATGDSYLPASRARALLGADTATTRLVEVEAHNHRFSGGLEQFSSALVDAVRWVSAGSSGQ